MEAGLSQQQLADMTSVKREHISNIELGKNSPAVKIVTDIATALRMSFELDGCTIGPTEKRQESSRPVAVPEQMSLAFDVEHQFAAASVILTSASMDSIELRAVFSRIRIA
jgi:transcriptional regulator with XRE-family HTH domain